MHLLHDYNECVPTRVLSETSPRADDQRLTDAALTASRVLVAVAARSLAAHEAEVSLAQYRVLILLASRGPQRLVDVASALEVDASTATRMADRLVRKNLVVRRRSGGDRREVHLELATRGRRLVDSVTARRRAEIARIVGSMPEADRSALIHAFAAFGSAAGEPPDESWRSWEL